MSEYKFQISITDLVGAEPTEVEEALAKDWESNRGVPPLPAAKAIAMARAAFHRNVLAFLSGCGIADDNLLDAEHTIAKALEVQGVAEEMLADVERLEKERNEALTILDEAGAMQGDDLVASLRWLIEDTNRQQKAVIDAAKACGIESVDANEAAVELAVLLRSSRAKWAKAVMKSDFWLESWKDSEKQKADLMHRVAALKGALAAAEARRS